MDGMSLLQDI